MYKISIPKPCHENWEAMSPREQGRFCQVCSKTVVDFTSMTDDAVQHYFLNNSHQATCGRFRQDQLTAITIYLPVNIFNRRISRWKKFLAACLLAFSTLLFSCETRIKGEPVKTLKDNSHKKTMAPNNRGYVGGFTLLLDSIEVKKEICTVTQGFSILVDSSFVPETDLPQSGADPMDTTDVINIADTTQQGGPVVKGMILPQPDSSATKDAIPPDSLSCDDQPFINL